MAAFDTVGKDVGVRVGETSGDHREEKLSNELAKEEISF